MSRNMLHDELMGDLFDKINDTLSEFILSHKRTLNKVLFPVFKTHLLNGVSDEKEIHDVCLAHRRALSHMQWHEGRTLVFHYLKRMQKFKICPYDGLHEFPGVKELQENNKSHFLKNLLTYHLDHHSHSSNKVDLKCIRTIRDNDALIMDLDKALESLQKEIIFFEWTSYRSRDKFWLMKWFGPGYVMSKGIGFNFKDRTSVRVSDNDYFTQLASISHVHYDEMLFKLYSEYKFKDRQLNTNRLPAPMQSMMTMFLASLEAEFAKRELLWQRRFDPEFQPVSYTHLTLPTKA